MPGTQNTLSTGLAITTIISDLRDSPANGYSLCITEASGVQLVVQGHKTTGGRTRI